MNGGGVKFRVHCAGGPLSFVSLHGSKVQIWGISTCDM